MAYSGIKRKVSQEFQKEKRNCLRLHKSGQTHKNLTRRQTNTNSCCKRQFNTQYNHVSYQFYVNLDFIRTVSLYSLWFGFIVAQENISRFTIVCINVMYDKNKINQGGGGGESRALRASV